MYVLASLVMEALKVVMNAGVVAFLGASRKPKGIGQDRQVVRDLLIELLKVLMSVGVGAVLGGWRERKRNEQARHALEQLRQEIGQDVLQALSQWSAQGQLTVERDDQTGEALAVTSRGDGRGQVA
jgi:hypothetical protein